MVSWVVWQLSEAIHASLYSAVRILGVCFLVFEGVTIVHDSKRSKERMNRISDSNESCFESPVKVEVSLGLTFLKLGDILFSTLQLDWVSQYNQQEETFATLNNGSSSRGKSEAVDLQSIHQQFRVVPFETQKEYC